MSLWHVIYLIVGLYFSVRHLQTELGKSVDTGDYLMWGVVLIVAWPAALFVSTVAMLLLIRKKRKEDDASS